MKNNAKNNPPEPLYVVTVTYSNERGEVVHAARSFQLCQALVKQIDEESKDDFFADRPTWIKTTRAEEVAA